jgi:NNP family nitrate/nitrite transporter-like MFS transporter
VFIVMTAVVLLLSMPNGRFHRRCAPWVDGAQVTFSYKLGLAPFVLLTFVLNCAMGIGKAPVYNYIRDYFPRHIGAVGGIVGMLGALCGFSHVRHRGTMERHFVAGVHGASPSPSGAWPGGT